jgi:hypothetical protein
MSRGPGVWQREILNALETQECIVLRDICPPERTGYQLAAIRRAAKRLARAGKVRIRGLPHYPSLTNEGRIRLGRLLVCRPDREPDFSKLYHERVKPFTYNNWY